MIHFVIGGARSGKSRFAEALLKPVTEKTYVATAIAFDEEMRVRIEFHKKSRIGDGWTTVETALDPASALRGGGAILLDCVTVWIGNLMHHQMPVRERMLDFLAKAAAYHGTLVIVSNEVGLGIVPDTQLGRRFRDIAGWANQEIAQLADEVTFMAAGLPLVLKQKSKRKAKKT